MNVAALKGISGRANVSLLSYAVMLFQLTAFLLLAFKKQPLDMQALTFAVGLPIITYVVVTVIPRIWKIDRILLTLVLFLCSVSLVTLQDVARAPSTTTEQAMFMVLGLGAMVLMIAFIRWLRAWEKWKYPLMILSLIAIALPLIAGEWQYGAKRWVRLFIVAGPMWQPTEPVKISLLLILAIFFSQRNGFRDQLVALGFAVALCVVALLGRNLGMLLMYFFLTLTIYFLSTSNGLMTLGGLGAGAVGSVGAFYMFEYVQKRVEMFLNPWSDPQVYGFQTIQALIAIGSGGLFGMGLGLGLPRNIPLYHADFIFAALSEEFGYLFALCLLAVYVLIVMRGISIAMNARSSFHALVAFGASVLLGLQTLVVVGGNTKLIPLTGETLPFIAAGGSSMITCFALIGLLLGISSINAQYEMEDLRRAEWQGGVPV